MSYATDENIQEFLDFILKGKDDNIGEKYIKRMPKINGSKVRYKYALDFVTKIDSEQRDKLNDAAIKLQNKLISRSEYDTTLKLLDYITLEIPRVNLYDKINKQIIISEKRLRDIRTETIKKDKLLSEHEKKFEKLQTDFISILSIFSAVVITFFGGITILANIFENIDKASKYRLFFTSLLIMIFVFDIIFMLMQIVAKIIKSDVGSLKKCDFKECMQCQEKHISVDCVKKRYPIAFWYNVLTIILMTGTTILYTLDHYDIPTSLLKIINCGIYKELVPIVASALFILIFFILGFVYKHLKDKYLVKCGVKDSKDNN